MERLVKIEITTNLYSETNLQTITPRLSAQIFEYKQNSNYENGLKFLGLTQYKNLSLHFLIISLSGRECFNNRSMNIPKIGDKKKITQET